MTTVQITNRGRMWWLLKDKRPVGFASTYKIALAKVRELEAVIAISDRKHDAWDAAKAAIAKARGEL